MCRWLEAGSRGCLLYSLLLLLLAVRKGDLIGRRILLGVFEFLLEVLQIVFGKRGLSSNSCN